MVRCFFIQAIPSLGCWTDIQAVHVRVSKPWAVAARQQFDASKKKHKTYAPKWTTGKHCLKQCFCSCKKQDWWSFSGILIYSTWLILIGVFLHPKKKHQISISFRWSLGRLGSNQGASSWDGKKIRNSALDRIRQKNAMRWMLLRRSHTNFRCLKTTWGSFTYKDYPKRTKTQHKKQLLPSHQSATSSRSTLEHSEPPAFHNLASKPAHGESQAGKTDGLIQFNLCPTRMIPSFWGVLFILWECQHHAYGYLSRLTCNDLESIQTPFESMVSWGGWLGIWQACGVHI